MSDADLQSDYSDLEADNFRNEIKMKVLQGQVTYYNHDNTLPKLPKATRRSLNGVAFVFDRDKDARILMAIEQLRVNKNIVAMSECNGHLEIYTRLPTKLKTLEVCFEEWSVTEYVPFQGAWVEYNQEFIDKCVQLALQPSIVVEHSDIPPCGCDCEYCHDDDDDFYNDWLASKNGIGNSMYY